MNPLLRYCRDGGWLVNARGWLPSEAYTWHFLPLGPFIGCSRLQCHSCGNSVRMDAGSGITRIYRCACAEWEVLSAQNAYAPDADPMLRPPTRWACVGHEALPLPSRWYGSTVDDDTAWGSWIERVACEPAEQVPTEFRAMNGFEVQHLYAILPHAARLRMGAAVASALRSVNVQSRLVAADFFASFLHTDWEEELFQAESVAVEAALSNPENKLEKRFYRNWVNAIAWRLSLTVTAGSSAERARDTLRRLACQPPGIGVYAKKLAVCDSEWVLEHQHRFVR